MRACYWTDYHRMILLTGPEHAHLPDAELLHVAEEEMTRIRVFKFTGVFEIGEWPDERAADSGKEAGASSILPQRKTDRRRNVG